MARIVTEKGDALEVTAEDALWLARAVEAEGEPRDKVAQVLLNRWAWLWDQNPRQYPTLTSLIRAYAQPVNPAWFPDGAKHREWVTEHASDAAAVAAERERAKVRRDVHVHRSEFSERTRRAVASALYGPVTIPPGAVHFGDARGGVNQILVSPDARGSLYWPVMAGKLEHGNAAMLHGPAHGAIGFVVLALGGALGFALSKGRSRRRK